MINNNEFEQIISRFQKQKIVVIGDLIADEYIFCETSRVSREAPVLILQHLSDSIGLGGALNVVQNLASLGATVLPIGCIGNDKLGSKILNILQKRGIETKGILSLQGFETISKTRILASSLHTTMQQVLRVDRGKLIDYHTKSAKLIEKPALKIIENADAIIFSDYGYGNISDNLLNSIRKKVTKNEITVTADSRFAMHRFYGLTAITPNEPEINRFLNQNINETDLLINAGKKILTRLQLKKLLITRGKLGMSLFQIDGKGWHLPVYGSDQVADVTGAGDTVIATFTLAQASQASALQAAILANFAGGMVVTKRGCATTSDNELIQAVRTTDFNISSFSF